MQLRSQLATRGLESGYKWPRTRLRAHPNPRNASSGPSRRRPAADGSINGCRLAAPTRFARHDQLRPNTTRTRRSNGSPLVSTTTAGRLPYTAAKSRSPSPRLVPRAMTPGIPVPGARMPLSSCHGSPLSRTSLTAPKGTLTSPLIAPSFSQGDNFTSKSVPFTVSLANSESYDLLSKVSTF